MLQQKRSLEVALQPSALQLTGMANIQMSGFFITTGALPSTPTPTHCPYFVWGYIARCLTGLGQITVTQGTKSNTLVYSVMSVGHEVEHEEHAVVGMCSELSVQDLGS